MENSLPKEPSIAQKLAVNSIISPQASNEQEHYNQASIIKGLSVNTQLKRIEVRAYGYRYNAIAEEWTKVTEPLMSHKGINKLMIYLESFGDLASFSNYSEEQIPRVVSFNVRNAYAEFVVYAKEYKLTDDRKREVLSILFNYCLSVLNNAKNAGHRNAVRGVLSENVLASALQQQGSNASSQTKKGFLSRMVPFGRKQ